MNGYKLWRYRCYYLDGTIIEEEILARPAIAYAMRVALGRALAFVQGKRLLVERVEIINYGRGMSNVDLETGIRYGVIHQNNVLQAWADSAEADYGEPSCPKCGDQAVEYNDDEHGEYETHRHSYCDYACESCGLILGSDYIYGDEALGFSLDDGEYEAYQSGNDCDIFILKSPYYTRCQFCSPCAPGAGYLMNECEDGPKEYCFGHDWFDEGKAPYKVFRVDNDEEVPPPDVN